MEEITQNKSQLIQGIDLDTLTFKIDYSAIDTVDILNRHCEICFKFHHNRNGRLWLNEEEGLEMMTCYGCHMIVHKYCYGIKTPINQIITDSGCKMNMFVCEKCQDQGPGTSQECAICFQYNGPLKKISDEKFVHVTCALSSDEFEITDFKEMRIEKCEPLNSENPIQSDAKMCEYCNYPCSIMQCEHEHCTKRSHIYCSFISRIESIYKDEECMDGWKLNLQNESSFYKFPLSAIKKELKKQIKIIFEAIWIVVERWNESLFLFSHEELESYYTKNKKGIKAKPNDTKKQVKYKRVVLKKIHKALNKRLKGVLETFPRAEESQEQKKGFISGKCQEHREPELFCLCHQPSSPTTYMFGCDACENWFHCECIGVEKNIIETYSNYFCDRCNDWAKIRKNFFAQDDNLEQEERIANNNDILPQNRKGFWIMDYIIASLMLQDRILEALCDTSSFEREFQDILQVAKLLPFKLNILLTRPLELYSISSCLDDVLLSPLLRENLQENRDRRESIILKKLEYITDLQEIYIKEGLIFSNIQKIKTGLYDQLNSIADKRPEQGNCVLQSNLLEEEKGNFPKNNKEEELLLDKDKSIKSQNLNENFKNLRSEFIRLSDSSLSYDASLFNEDEDEDFDLDNSDFDELDTPIDSMFEKNLKEFDQENLFENKSPQELSIKWLQKLHVFYSRNIYKVHINSDNFEIEKSVPENENSGEKVSFSLFEEVENMINSCLPKLDNIEETVRTQLNHFKELIEEGTTISHDDIRITHVFLENSRVFWRIEVETRIYKKAKFKKEGLDWLNRLAYQLCVKYDDDSYQKFIELYNEYSTWILEYRKFKFSVECYSQNTLIEQRVFQRLLYLKEKSETLLIDLEDERNTIVSSSLLFQAWKSEAECLWRELCKGTKINFKNLDYLIKNGELIKGIKTDPWYQKLHKLYKSETFHKEGFEAFVVVNEDIKSKFSLISNNLNSLHEDEENEFYNNIQETKLSIEQALLLQEACKNTRTLLFDKEKVKELDEEIKKLLRWKEKIINLVQKKSLKCLGNFDEEEILEIIKNLEKVKEEMRFLLFRDPKQEEDLHIFEWNLKVPLLLCKKKGANNKPLQKDITEFKKLLEIASKIKATNLELTSHFKQLQEQVELYEKNRRVILSLEEQTGFLHMVVLTKMDIKSIRRGLDSEFLLKNLLTNVDENCQVDDPESRQFILNLLEDIQQLKTSFKDLTSPPTGSLIEELSTKGSETERKSLNHFHDLLNRLYTLPVYLENEEGFIEEAISKREGLSDSIQEEDLRESEKSTQEVNSGDQRNSPDQFREQPFSFFNIKNIEKNSITLLGFFKIIQEMEDQPGQIRYAQLKKLNEELAKYEIGPLETLEQYDAVKMKIWEKKVEGFQELAQGIETLGYPVPFSDIKNILLEGYEYLCSGGAIKEFKGNIGFLEQLIKEGEAHAKKINKQLQKPESRNQDNGLIWKGFVDLTEEVTQIGLVKSMDKRYSSVVRNIGNKNDSEILKIINSQRKEIISEGKNEAKMEIEAHSQRIMKSETRETDILLIRANSKEEKFDFEFSNNNFDTKSDSKKGNKRKKGAKTLSTKQTTSTKSPKSTSSFEKDAEEQEAGNNGGSKNKLIKNKSKKSKDRVEVMSNGKRENSSQQSVREVIEILDEERKAGRESQVNNEVKLLGEPTKKIKIEKLPEKVIQSKEYSKAVEEKVEVKGKKRIEVKKKLIEIFTIIEGTTERDKKRDQFCIRLEKELFDEAGKDQKEYQRRYERLYSFLLDVNKSPQKDKFFINERFDFGILQKVMKEDNDDCDSLNPTYFLNLLDQVNTEQKDLLCLPEHNNSLFIETNNSTPACIRKGSFSNAEPSPYQGNEAHCVSPGFDPMESREGKDTVTCNLKANFLSLPSNSEKSTDKSLQRITLSIPKEHPQIYINSEQSEKTNPHKDKNVFDEQAEDCKQSNQKNLKTMTPDQKGHIMNSLKTAQIGKDLFNLSQLQPRDEKAPSLLQHHIQPQPIQKDFSFSPFTYQNTASPPVISNNNINIQPIPQNTQIHPFSQSSHILPQIQTQSQPTQIQFNNQNNNINNNNNAQSSKFSKDELNEYLLSLPTEEKQKIVMMLGRPEQPNPTENIIKQVPPPEPFSFSGSPQQMQQMQQIQHMPYPYQPFPPFARPEQQQQQRVYPVNQFPVPVYERSISYPGAPIMENPPVQMIRSNSNINPTFPMSFYPPEIKAPAPQEIEPQYTPNQYQGVPPMRPLLSRESSQGSFVRSQSLELNNPRPSDKQDINVNPMPTNMEIIPAVNQMAPVHTNQNGVVYVPAFVPFTYLNGSYYQYIGNQ